MSMSAYAQELYRVLPPNRGRSFLPTDNTGLFGRWHGKLSELFWAAMCSSAQS